jgi:hypothetical protein
MHPAHRTSGKQLSQVRERSSGATRGGYSPFEPNQPSAWPAYRPSVPNVPARWSNNQWSFAGRGKDESTELLLQPFLNYNFGEGRYITR